MAFFGTGTPTTKVVTSGFPLLLAPILRLLLAAVLTTPLLVIFRDDVRRIGRRDWLLIAGIGSVGLVAFSLFLMTGMTMVNGVVGAMVMSTSPAAVAVGAAWFLGDELGPRKLAGIQAMRFDFATPSLEQWLALAWWGVGPFGIGTLLWFVGLKYVDASTASGFMGAMPASGLIVSYMWLGDRFYWIHLVGFGLVVAAIALVAWAHRRSHRRDASAGREFQGCHAYPC